MRRKKRIKDNEIIHIQKCRQNLIEYFDRDDREIPISNAIKDGYTQKEIASYLNLSNTSVSKIYKTYKQKVQLFNKLKDKGIFWSYSESIVYNTFNTNIFIEYILKYGDFDDISLGLELFSKKLFKKIWNEKLKSDKQFIKTNLMIARVFFDMDVESDYFKGIKNERFEKLKLLAS